MNPASAKEVNPMLNDLFDEVYKQYRSLPLLGSVLDDFDDWLGEQGYALGTRQNHITHCAHIEDYFWKRGVRRIAELSTEKFGTCRRYFKLRTGRSDYGVACLHRYLQERQLLSARDVSQPVSIIDEFLIGYREYLVEVRGFSPSTVQAHCQSVLEFLRLAKKDNSEFQLHDLDRGHIEKFIIKVGRRVGRGTLQHAVAHVRGLLRYLCMLGKVPAGLDSQVDTPRVYRQEQLPKSLPWDVVCAFVESIDRSDAQGLRDYAMCLLIAKYGLRASDVAGLKLEDINWRAAELHFNQRKTGYPLILPLFDRVGEALVAYLRDGRPSSKHREVFLTLRAPISPVTIHTIGPAFRERVRRGDLPIPFEGVHCLRHSYAMHLLRSGMPLKAIGDVLGHRSTEATCVYIRLNVDELRDVGLPLPTPCHEEVC